MSYIYKRYNPNPSPNRDSGFNVCDIPPCPPPEKPPPPKTPYSHYPPSEPNHDIYPPPPPKPAGTLDFLLKFIPTSLYNPDTGKILGFLSAEDLLIVALILLLTDNGDDDNGLLILALLYLLISDKIDLPF